MRTEIEDRLEAVLATAASAAPQPGADFITGVRGRVRRHRRRRVMLGICGVAAVVLAGALVPAAVRHPARVDQPALPPPPMPDLVHLRPAEQVWPQAVVELPARLPDGRGYVVLLALGGKRYLVRSVETWIQGEPRLGYNFGPWTEPPNQRVKLGAVEVLNAAAGTATLVSAKVPEDAEVYPSPAGVAWTVVRGSIVEFWAATIGGSGGTWLASYPKVHPVDVFGRVVLLLPDRIVFEESAIRGGSRSYYPDASLLSVSVRGGPVVPVPGSTGFELPDRPIAGVDGGSGVGPPWAVRPDMTARPDREGFVPIVEMWNLATGQRIVGRDMRGCDPPWCLPKEGIVLRPMNGTGSLSVPPGGTAVFMAGSRFVTGYRLGGTSKDARFIWDITTGLAAALSRLHQETDEVETNIIQLGEVRPGRPHRILDLTAIPLLIPGATPGPSTSPGPSQSPNPDAGQSPGPVDSPSQPPGDSRSPSDSRFPPAPS
jgi:hypothetical protein